MIYKGDILKAWGKKQAVAIHEDFYSTLPSLPAVTPKEADIAWLIYGLDLDPATNRYHLARRQTVHTLFQPALDKITTPEPGDLAEFITKLQEKLEEKLNNSYPPDAPTLTDIMSK